MFIAAALRRGGSIPSQVRGWLIARLLPGAAASSWRVASMSAFAAFAGAAGAPSPPPGVPGDGDSLLGPIVEGDAFEALGDLTGITLYDLVDRDLLPVPPLLDWAGWRNWRRTLGCRPREPLQSSGLKSAFTAREGRLYRGLMQSIYDSSWKDQLHDQTVAASMEAEEAADLAEEARSRELRA